jgi:hypothetical protein
MSATMKRLMPASVITVSVKSRSVGRSKSKTIGSKSNRLISSLMASSTCLRSVKRQRINTPFRPMVSMALRIFSLFRSR